MGGLSKKAFQLEKIRGLHDLPYLTLDGGNLLFKEESLSPALLQQAMITAGGIVDSYVLMHYDAVAVGRNDLAAGISFLKEQANRTGLPWLSANLVQRSDKKPFFSASLIRRVGSLSVGIIGLTGDAGAPLFQDTEDAAILPWQEVLPGVVADLSARSDLVIILSNNTDSVNKKIAETVEGVHIIIQSTPRSANSAPQLVNGCIIAQTGKQGKYLGWMLVNWQPSKTWGRDGATKDLATKKQELDGLNGRISRIERREKKEDLPANSSYQNLLAAREVLLSEIIFLENELYDLRAGGQAPSTFENYFIGMDINLPDQPDVQKIVEATKQKVNQAGRTQADASAASAALPELELEKLTFTGWMACGPCHSPQTEFWKTTGHFSAYQTLVAQEQQFNLDCLPCHVTAEFGDEKISDNDSVLLSLPPVLQQVGCEACHGPGKTHAASKDSAGIIRKPAPSVCTRCHTPERSEKFNYENDSEKIACPASRQ